MAKAAPAVIYDKFTKGDSLTDAELNIGITHFKTMADLLYASGPAFKLAANESNRVYLALEGFRDARQFRRK